MATALRWLDGIKANAGSHLYPDNETVSEMVNRGVVAFGVVNQYYWYRMRAEIGAADVHSRIAYFAPRDPGYVLDISGAGILKSSKHRAAAQRFLAFLVSAKGQEIIAHSISFEYPIASGVKTVQPETPLDDLEPDPIDVGELGTGAQAIALLRDVQLLERDRSIREAAEGPLGRESPCRRRARAPARLPPRRGRGCWRLHRLAPRLALRLRRASCGTRSGSPLSSRLPVR